MKKNLFEMGSNFSDGWQLQSDEKPDEIKIIPKKEHQLVFKMEKRKGKPVTLVGRFWISSEDKKLVLSKIKKTLCTGGTICDEWIEVQGDMKEKIKTLLASDGWKFK